MSVTAKTVREMVLESPAVARVFEKLGIDYCCGGNRSLKKACEAAHLDIDTVLDTLETTGQSQHESSQERAWQAEPLAQLMAHIKSIHHKYTREEIARLGPLFDKVCAAHGKNHPELLQARSIFGALAHELTRHMMKEEMVLFPYVVRMEEAVVEKAPIVPPPFASVQNPIFMMEHEHDAAGQALREMREATQGYTAPSDACVSFQTLYKALQEFEADLHRHIHLENNILFPRAVEMENNAE